MMLTENAHASLGNSINYNNSSTKQHRFMPKWCKVNDASGGPTPRPRHGHRAVAIKELMLVFGGGNEGIVDELHLYDTNANQWYVPDLRGIRPRGYAAYGMVTNQSKVFIFGGMVEFGRYSNDLFELHTKRWEWRQLRVRAPANGKPEPCPRLGHSFTMGLNNIAYVFGGLANDSDDPKFNVPKYLDDFYAIDLSVTHNVLLWHCPQTNGQRPSPRESHTTIHFTTQTGGEQLIVYGGMNGVRLGDVWILDLVTMNWSNPVPAGIEPLPRSLHTASVIGHRMFIFGGWVPTRPEDKLEHMDKEWKCTSTLAILNLNTLRWEHTLGPSSSSTPSSILIGTCWPTARAGHSAAIINKRIYIWSGRDGYKKMWNSQVCCKDMFFLETEPSSVPSGIQLVKATVNSLEISWTPSPTAERYILQIQRAEHQPDFEKLGRRAGVRTSQRHSFGSIGAGSPHQRASVGVSASASSSVRAIRPSTAAVPTSYRRYYQPQQQMNSSLISSSSYHLGGSGSLRIKSSDATPSHMSPIDVQQQQHQIGKIANRTGTLADSVVCSTAASPSSHVSHLTMTNNQRHSQLSNSSQRTIIVHKSTPMMASSDLEGGNIVKSTPMQLTGPKRIYVHSSPSQHLSIESLATTTNRNDKQFPNCSSRQRPAMASSNTFEILPPPAKMLKQIDFVPSVPGIVSSELPLSSATTKTTYAVPTAPLVIDQSMPHNILDEALNEAENFVDEQQQQQLKQQQQQREFNTEYNNNVGKQQQGFIASADNITHGTEEDEAMRKKTVEEREMQEKNKDLSPKYQPIVEPMIKTKLTDSNDGINNNSKNDEKTTIDNDNITQDDNYEEIEQMRSTDPDSECDSKALKDEAVEQQHAAQMVQPLERDYNQQQHDDNELLGISINENGPSQQQQQNPQQLPRQLEEKKIEDQIGIGDERYSQQKTQPSEDMAPIYDQAQHTAKEKCTNDGKHDSQQQHQQTVTAMSGPSQQRMPIEEGDEHSESVGIGHRIAAIAEQQHLQQLLPVSVLDNSKRERQHSHPLAVASQAEPFHPIHQQRSASSFASDFVPHPSSIDSSSKWFHVVDLPSSTQRFVITQYNVPFECRDGSSAEDESMKIGSQLTSDQQDEQQQQQITANTEQRNVVVALKPGTLYRIRCRAVNSVGYSGWSQPVSFKTCMPGFPGSPTSIKITKCPEGVFISWDPPLTSNGQIEEYSVFLLTRSQQHGSTHLNQVSAVSFTRVYVGPAPNCVISHSVLRLAHIDITTMPKPAIIFRISARNEKGYGSATQVRWLQESPRAVPVAVMPPSILQPPATIESFSSTETSLLPQQQHIMSPSTAIGGVGGRVVQKHTASAPYQQQLHEQYQQKYKRSIPNMINTTTTNPNISVREFLSNTTNASKRGPFI